MAGDVFARPTGIDWRGGGTYGQVQYGDDSNLFVQFYWKSVINDYKSRETNRPYYENKEYIIIQVPGETLNQINRPIKDEDKYRFPRQWQQFQLNKTQVPEGAPIELLFPNTPAYADTLKARGVYTIEQAAELSGNAMDGMGMGAQELVNKAQLYIKQSGNSKIYNKLRGELEKKDQEIKILSQNVEKQRKLIDDLYVRVGGNTATPAQTMQNAPYVPGYDPQVERINSTQPTQEIKNKLSKSAQKKVKNELIKQETDHEEFENEDDLDM